MKVKLAKHERAILGLCEIFYRQQYTKLKHDAVRNMLYLLYRKGIHVKSYPYVCDTNGPCSAELEADLKELDMKQDLIMDFYEADLTVHAVPAAYLAAAECMREVLRCDDESDVIAWTAMLAMLSCLAEHEVGNENSIIVCNRYIMMKPHAEYESVKRAWQVLEDAKMTFTK